MTLPAYLAKGTSAAAIVNAQTAFEQNGKASVAPYTNAGAPTNGSGGTLATFAPKGSLLLDTTNGVLYQNTGTLAAPIWSAVQVTMGAGGAAFGPMGNISKQFGSPGNGADTTEDTLVTFNLPANSLQNVGQGVCIQAFGSIGATSATKTAKLYFGTSLTNSIVATTTQTGAWEIYAEVFKTAAGVQCALFEQDFAGGATVRNVAVSTTGSEVDTAAITIKATGQSSVATAGLVVCNGLIVTAMD